MIYNVGISNGDKYILEDEVHVYQEWLIPNFSHAKKQNTT